MNRIFSIVWNRARRAWMVAGEHAAGCAKDSGGRPGRTFAAALLAGLLVSAPAIGQSLPTGGEVVAGHGSIGTPHAGSLAIEQSSQRMVIDWQQFNIGAGNTVRFNQPGTDAVALNRVLGADASQIMGQLQANGRVFLVNPNGVLFGQGAEVDVGGLVASTLGIGNADFMAGNYRFQGGPSANGRPASVVNQGRITAAEGGAVALLGGQVHNQGVVQARLGTVAMAAGNAVTLDFAGDGLLRVQIDQAAKDALVDNGQLVQADGGQVLMTASASDALLQTVVNNTGVIEARTLANRAGKIVLLGDFAGGTVKVDGRLDASAPDGGDGGFIDTSGAYVRVADGVQVTTLALHGKTGTWLIDPTDFIITAGSDPETPSSIGADTLSAALEHTDVEIATDNDSGNDPGDIHVESPVSWSGDTTLTLAAYRHINVKADIKGLGESSGLVLEAGTGAGQGDVLIAADRVMEAGNQGIYMTGRALTTERGSMLTVNGEGGHVFAEMTGDISIGGDIVVDGVDGVIFLEGHNLSVNSGISVQGDGGTIALGACGAPDCGHIAINGDVSIVGDSGTISMVGEQGISIDGSISITGELGTIALLGQNIVTGDDSTVSMDGTGGVIAMMACGVSGCTYVPLDDELWEENDTSAFADMEGVISINGDVSLKGDSGVIALIGGDVFIESAISIEGADGVIAVAACGDSGCGDILVNDDVSIKGDNGVIVMMANDGIYTAGNISIDGNGGMIGLSADTLEISEAVFIQGDDALINLSGGNVLVDGTVAIMGDGFISLETCSCDPGGGDIVVNGDVAITGEGAIDISSDRDITLNAALWAEAVFMEAEGDIVAAKAAMITTPQFDVRSNGGAILLDQGVHQVGELAASAQSGLRFVNGGQLIVETAFVAGDGDIAIRTTEGDLTLPSSATSVVQIAGSGDIDLISAGGFHNLAGAGALQAANGNWRIWSQNPAHSALGGLGYEFKQYNAHYGSSAVLGQGNGVLYAFAPVLDVGLTGSTAKTYDGTDLAALDDTNYVLKGGVYGDDQVVFSKPTDGRYSDQNAGEGKTVTAHGLQVLQAYEAGGAQVYGYQINTSASADIGRIDKRPITVAASDQSKFLGQADPALTWRIAAGELVSGDGFIGALARDAGEALGAYVIRQGSLSAGANYVLDFIDGKLVVLPATADDVLGERAPAYQAAIVSAQNLQQGPMAFDQSAQGDGAVGSALGGSQPSTLYHIENSGLRMPEGI